MVATIGQDAGAKATPMPERVPALAAGAAA
jgi:hypothetical protein